jgi:hypothetical protein
MLTAAVWSTGTESAAWGGICWEFYRGCGRITAQIHDRPDIEWNGTADGKGYCHTIRAEYEDERPVEGHSFVRAEEFLKLFTGLQSVIRIHGASGEHVEFTGDRPVRADNCG